MMNTFKTLPFVAVTAMFLTVAACNNPGRASNKNSSNDSIPGKGFALLELYTSEGCSSCPPADRLLARVQKEAGNRPIFLLCEHVDYWDDAHWKDAFSQHQFSQRQYRYDSRLKSQVYTPQLIVNGKKECLGSDEAAVNAAVKNAVAKESNVNLDLKARQQGNNIQISYSINGNSPANKLLIAVIEKHAVREIGDGENRGKTLNHAQIVRSLSSFTITGNKGVEQISLPVDYNAGNYEIVGFLQDENTDEIVSAARAQDHG
jgi:hypothetical protein